MSINACCLSTGRDAYFRGLAPLVLADGTACYGVPNLGFGACTPEETQRWALADVARHWGPVATVAESEAELREGGA